MKLRIKSNSIRFRLTKSDVSKLAATGSLDESVSFGASSLAFAIRTSAGNALASVFNNDTVTLFMPQHMITELAETDKVGFESREGDLHLLVEKDFTCLENIGEDQSDNYPNPLAHQHHEE
jgi:hypothetical protein